jgi:hypothetical protein
MIQPAAVRPPAEASQQWDWIPLFFLIVPGFSFVIPARDGGGNLGGDERRDRGS